MIFAENILEFVEVNFQLKWLRIVAVVLVLVEIPTNVQSIRCFSANQLLAQVDFQPINCLHKWIFSQSAACTSGFSANQLLAQVDFMQPTACTSTYSSAIWTTILQPISCVHNAHVDFS